MPTFKPSPQMRRMQIIALLLLVASGIVNYLDRSALSIANIEVRQELGLSATVMGVLLSAFLMSYAFSQLPAGILVDRVGPRALLGVGLVIWSVAQGAAGFVTSYAQFFAARIGLGIGEVTAVSDRSPRRQQLVPRQGARSSDRHIQFGAQHRHGSRATHPDLADAGVRLAHHVHRDGGRRTCRRHRMVCLLSRRRSIRDRRGPGLYPFGGHCPEHRRRSA